MVLLSVAATNIRCIQRFNLNFHSNFTVIVGENGCGKTSMLETLYLMAYGRSFRTSQLDKVIMFHVEQFMIKAKILPPAGQVPLMLEVAKRRDGSLQRKISGECASKSSMARLSPILLLNHDSFNFFNGGPEARRKFLLQAMFHVEPEFNKVWKDYQKALHQRNYQLKSKRVQPELIAAWNQELVTLAKKITRYQQQFLVKYNQIFKGFCHYFLPEFNISVELLPGWDGEDFAVVLEQSFLQDRALGYTKFGPHRADLLVKTQEHLAQDVLSRGQQKLFVAAINLGVAEYIRHYAKKQSIVLIDDIGAELDKGGVKKLLDWVYEANLQTVITAIDANTLQPYLPHGSYDLFHVEHLKKVAIDASY